MRRLGCPSPAFAAAAGDCFSTNACDDFSEALGRDVRGRYDAVQCNLALHYAWRDEATARAALRNAAAMLKPGGVFYGMIADEAFARHVGARGSWLVTSPANAAPDKWVARAAATRPGAYTFNLRDPLLKDERTGQPWQLFQDGQEAEEYLVPRAQLEAFAAEAGLVSVAPARELRDIPGIRWPARKDFAASDQAVVSCYRTFAFRKSV